MSVHVTAVHLENTDGNADKFYRILRFGDDLVTIYGPRGRPGTPTVQTGQGHFGPYERALDAKLRGGYEQLVVLSYDSGLAMTGRDTALAASAEFDQQWARQLAPVLASLGAAAVTTGGLADDWSLVSLPKFAPPRPSAKVGGARDAHPWGPALDRALHHTRHQPQLRTTYAAVLTPVGQWAARHYPGAQTCRLTHGTDPGRLVEQVCDLAPLNTSWPLADLTDLAAAVIA